MNYRFALALIGCGLGFITGPTPPSLVCSVDDGTGDGAGEGGGDTGQASTRADPAAGAAATTQPGTAAAKEGAATTERRFTQAELDQIVTERLARDRQARGRTETTSTERRPKVTEAERLDRIESDNAFYRGLARLDTKLTEDQEADLLDLFRVHKPERPGEWLAERATRFGLSKKDTAQTAATTATTTTTAEPKRGADTVPNRVDPLAAGGLVDVTKLSSEELKKLGPQGVRRELERVIEAGQAAQGRPPIPAVLRKK